MTKHVFQNSQVAHVWASQSQSEGRSSNGNFFFRDRNLYSYGSHFLVGRIMPDNVVLLNSKSYSISTSGHQSDARGATSHMTQYYVPDLTALDNTYALTIDPSLTVKGQRTYYARIVEFLRDHWNSTPENSAHYLLTFTGDKKAASTWKRIKTECERAEAKAAAAAEKAARKELLDYGAKVANASDAKIDELIGRAAIVNNGRELTGINTKLHHTHRALKAAKRDKQAARVYEVLKLGRALVALDARRRERIEKNYRLRHAIRAYRDETKTFSPLESWSAQKFGAIRQALLTISESRRIKGALHDQLAQAYVMAREAQELAREQEEREREAKDARELEAWLNGDKGVRRPYVPYGGATLIRAVDVTRDASGVITGGTLETSQGAEVPLTHAVRVFRFLKLCRESQNGRTDAHDPNAIVWRSNGHSVRVGHFKIDHVYADGSFKAGCHNIGWSEVERVARLLGVFELEADQSAVTETNAEAA